MKSAAKTQMHETMHLNTIRAEGERVSQKLTVLQKILAGDLKWKGPRLGLVFILFLMNWAYLILFLVTVCYIQ